MSDLVPVCLEKNALNFYLNRGVKSEEIYSVDDAEWCLEKERAKDDRISTSDMKVDT